MQTIIDSSMKTYTEQLDKIQKRALKIIDRNAYKDLKYIAFEHMYDLTHLNVRRRQQYLSLMYRLSRNRMCLDNVRLNIVLRTRHMIKLLSDMTNLIKVLDSPYY